MAANVSGGPAGGVGTTHAYDAAGNRTRVATGGVPSPQPSPTPPSSSSVVVANAGFAQPNVGGGFTYRPSVSGNHFGGGAGVAADGSAWSFPAAPDGDGQVAFLQSSQNGAGDPTVVAMAVSGLTVGASYVVRFQISLRPGYHANQLYVTIGGTSLGHHTPSASAWQQVQTVAFTAAQASTTVAFTGQTGGDSGTGIDAVEVVPAGGGGGATPTTVASASFESPAVASHEYGPGVAGATFASHSGVAANGGAFGFPATGDGNQAGFLQTSNTGAGTITLGVTGLTAGATYRIVVKAATRPGFAASQFRAGVGGTTLLDAVAPAGWTSFTSAGFTATAQSMSVVFQAVPQGGADTATAIDAVQVVPQ